MGFKGDEPFHTVEAIIITASFNEGQAKNVMYKGQCFTLHYCIQTHTFSKKPFWRKIFMGFFRSTVKFSFFPFSPAPLTEPWSNYYYD